MEPFLPFFRARQHREVEVELHLFAMLDGSSNRLRTSNNHVGTRFVSHDCPCSLTRGEMTRKYRVDSDQSVMGSIELTVFVLSTFIHMCSNFSLSVA